MLAFSSDEQHIITGNNSGAVRLWATPFALATSEGSLVTKMYPGHQLWRESGDSITAISPGGKHLAIGDGGGHVHILRVGANAEEQAAASDELSFLGHRGAIVGLAFSQNGVLVASAGLDREIRIWDTSTGLPRPFHIRTLASQIDQITFSPTGGRLAVIGGQRLWVISTDTGAVLADVDLGEPHAGLVFAVEERLYVGGESGALRNLASDRTGNWHLRNIWQGPSAIRKLAMSPNKRQLVVVDAQHVAKILNIDTGRIGASTLSLPDTVTDILFGSGEARVLLRTARWIHRVGVSPAGLIWLDAIRSPKALAGSQMVFDHGAADGNSDPFGDRVILLTRNAGFPEVAELRFSHSAGPALFGNKDKLLADWRLRLGMDQRPN